MSPLRQTHTYARLALSADAFAEIAAKLKAAGYDHAFSSDGTEIDLHGIGIARDDAMSYSRQAWIYHFLRLLTEQRPTEHPGLRHNLSYRPFCLGRGITDRSSELVLSISINEEWRTLFLDEADCAKSPADAVRDVLAFLDAAMAAEQPGARA